MKFIGAILSCVLAATPLCATDLLSWGDLRDEIQDNLTVKILDNAGIAYLKSFRNSEQYIAAETSFAQYRFFSADIGVAGNEPKPRAIFYGGVTLHIDQLMAKVFPKFAKDIHDGLTRYVDEKFWGKTFVGIWTGPNSLNGEWDHGVRSGLAWKWGK